MVSYWLLFQLLVIYSLHGANSILEYVVNTSWLTNCRRFLTMSAIRMLFLFMAAFISLGIWLTGINNVHWLLYIPPVALLFAGVTGICPGYMIFKKLGFKGQDSGSSL